MDFANEGSCEVLKVLDKPPISAMIGAPSTTEVKEWNAGTIRPVPMTNATSAAMQPHLLLQVGWRVYLLAKPLINAYELVNDSYDGTLAGC